MPKPKTTAGNKITSLADDVLHSGAEFFDFGSIGTVESASRGLRDWFRTNTDWDILINRDFSEFAKTYPRLQSLISSKELSGKLKYKSIVKFLIDIQKNEIQLAQELLNESIVRNHFVLNVTDYLREKTVQEINVKLKELKTHSVDQPVQEQWDIFLWNESILNAINCIIITEVINRLPSDDPELILDNLITRLPIEMLTRITDIKNLQDLSLNACNLYHCPTEIFNLMTLKALSLAHNHLIKIPEEIFQLLQLEALNVMSNELTELPRGLFSLPRLQRLFLGNKPFVFEDTHSITMRTKGNYFSELPIGIEQLSTLQELDIRSVNLKKLRPALGALRELTLLNAVYNELNDIPREIQMLPNLSNGLWLVGNPMEQWGNYFLHVNPVGRALTFGFNSLNRSMCWAYDNPREVISYVGVPLLAMFVKSQNPELLQSLYKPSPNFDAVSTPPF